MTDSEFPQLRVKPGRQFPFLARHPWVQAHALIGKDRGAAGNSKQKSDSVHGNGSDLELGQIVDLVDVDGNFLGRGLVNPHSRLRVRLYSFDARTRIDDAFWVARIDEAIGRRRLIGEAGGDEAERLVFSEADLLSGLIVDRYADCLGVQFTAGALLRWKRTILDHLKSVCGSRQIVVRVDEKTARLEGVDADPGSTYLEGDSLSEPVSYRQNGLDLSVDLIGGQKTGGYLDQRLNHSVAAGLLSGMRVLDVCCYTGGFGLLAAKRGAKEVTGIDSSAAALAAAQASAERNGVVDRMTFLQEDCFDALKRLAGEGQQFDAVILDPPRFAGSRRQVEQAYRAYFRLNSLALGLLPPGGILVSCSCSGRVSRSDFLNMLVDVGRRARRDIIVLHNRGPAPDHPLAVGCPESDYLKCLITQVM